MPGKLFSAARFFDFFFQNFFKNKLMRSAVEFMIKFETTVKMFNNLESYANFKELHYQHKVLDILLFPGFPPGLNFLSSSLIWKFVCSL